MPRRTKDAYTETWELWRRILAIFSMLMWIPLTFWIGLPAGLSLAISAGGVVAAWRPLHASGDPRLGSYVEDSWVYKVSAFITRAKAVASQYWQMWLDSKPLFFTNFFRSIGGGMPFPDPWHLTPEEQRAFEESEANTPTSIKDYSSRISLKSFIPKRLSTIWSLVFALIAAGVEYPITQLTGLTVSWGFSLPVFVSYPISAFFFFVLAQYYCITRLTQGNWGEERSLIPAPAIMIDRLRKEHLESGIRTSLIAFFVAATLVGSFVVYFQFPILNAAIGVIVFSTIVTLIALSAHAKKPWRAPWREHLDNVHAMSNAFNSVLSEEFIPKLVNVKDFPTDSEMEEIRATWREKRDAGQLSDEEAEQAPVSTNKIAIFLYDNTGLNPVMLNDNEENIEQLIPSVNAPAFIFPERNDRDDEPIPGTVTDEGFQMLYSTEHKNFSLRDLVSRKYPIWDEELAIHNTILRSVSDFFSLPVQLVETIWHTEEDSPSHILELIVFPITNKSFSLDEFNKFADTVESSREIGWIRTNVSSVNGLSNHISILLSDNVRDEKMKFSTNGLTVQRMIDKADWLHVFRRAGVVSSDGTLPEFKYAKQSTELVKTSSFMLPTELDRNDVKYMADHFKKLTRQDFVEIKGGWDYAKNANDATKRRAKDQKAFSILSAEKDPLDRMFMFGDYSDFTLIGRKEYHEQIDWVAGINSADQPATDSFIKGDAPHLLIAGESGSGKPVHPDTLVWTYETGLERIADIKTGTLILGEEGKFHKVKNVFAARDEADTFTISRGDSENALVAGKHLWQTRVSVDLDMQSIDLSLANLNAFDEVQPADTEALKFLPKSAGEYLRNEPLNISGTLPSPVNGQYTLGTGESSPQARNARSMRAMMGVSPQLAAVLIAFAKNHYPDGHIIVQNPEAAENLFSVTGYRLQRIGQLESGAWHMWCEDIHPLLSQIDFEHCDYAFFTTSLASTQFITIDVDQVRHECAAALINCAINADSKPEQNTYTATIHNAKMLASENIEFFARCIITGMGRKIDSVDHYDLVRLANDKEGTVHIHRNLVNMARQSVVYNALRTHVAAQHSAATGALSMLHKLSDDQEIYATTHTELMYYLLLCGLSVNTHEHNDGLLVIESIAVKERRDLILPLFDEINPLKGYGNDLSAVHMLGGICAAIGTIHHEDTEQATGALRPIVTLHCASDKVAQLMKNSENISKHSGYMGDVDEPFLIPGNSAGQFILNPRLYEAMHECMPGSWQPAIGTFNTCVQYTDNSLITLHDRHDIVQRTGLSYSDVSLILLGVKPDAHTRCDYDMVSPTGRSVVHTVHGVRELYSAQTISVALHSFAQHSKRDVNPVLTTFALRSHQDIVEVPYLVDEDGGIPNPTSLESTSETRWSTCDVDVATEETSMMCITVDNESHTFMIADNGLLTHNSVFVQSMLTQLSYNNAPTEVLEWLLDPKIGLQRMMTLDNCEKFLDPWTPDTNFFANCADFFAEGVDRMANERNAKLASTPDPETGIPPEKLGEARETARIEGHTKDNPHHLMFPYIFMAIEECATVFADAGSKEEAAYQSDVLRHAGRIAREGRSAGVLEICMTQYPTNASIPSQIRNQMRRAGLKCRNSFASNIIIDEDGLEQLTLPGSVMLRDDTGEYRRARGFVLRNGKPSRGEANDLMEILGSLPKNTSSQAGMTTSATGASQVTFSHDLTVDMEMLYDDVFVSRMSHGVDNPVSYDFEATTGQDLAEKEMARRKTRSKLETESDLFKAMEKAGEKSSAPWLKNDDSGKPISNSEYTKRADSPAVPTASGRRKSGRKSRLQ